MIGEKRINNFGSEMIIVEEEKSRVKVVFPKYKWSCKCNYKDFKRGNVGCPYEPRLHKHGYVGEGIYKQFENGKMTKVYSTWEHMIRRCYKDKYYKDCRVSEEWLNFQNFAKWFYDNYYEIEGEVMTLDKDIFSKDEKIYSAETCIFVPQRINLLFVNNYSKKNNSLPKGVSYLKSIKKYRCYMNKIIDGKSKQVNLGYYDTVEQAKIVYDQEKIKYIKEVAEEYKDKIPNKLYEYMKNLK